MRLFDAYLFIDWSALGAPAPKGERKDAIWVGELGPDTGPAETYCRGRAEATALVRDRLVAHVDDGRRVLVGFDFPYGYPAGLADCLRLGAGAPWRAVWDRLGSDVVDDEANRSNRFAVGAALNRRIGNPPGPFWGCPAAAATPDLTAGRKGLFGFPFAAPARRLERLRRTEAAIGGVQETWKLSGAGSVGSQALVGIPRVRALRDDPQLASVSSVWPFETGFTTRPVPAAGPWILHAEIWPGIIGKAEVTAEQVATGAIRDQAQVRLMCRWAAGRDREGSLGDCFASTALADADRHLAVAEEGWILGCPA